jgi:16S rRNA (guanine(527)-N(7))-methyltransferase RsmG
MDQARIAELLEPFLRPCHSEAARSCEEPAALSTNQLQDISTYIDILQRWNARINLTAIRTEEEIVTRHFGESFFAARHLFPRTTSDARTAALGSPPERSLGRPIQDVHKSGQKDRTRPYTAPHTGDLSDRQDYRGRAALQGPREVSGKEKGASAPAVSDVGSGAGFPGIPLKLWAPQIHLTLIESNHKKSTFLREVTRALILTDINIQTTRAETLTQRFDVVTLRAVGRFDQVLPTAARLLAPSGRLTLLIGAAQVPQARATLPKLRWCDPISIPESQSRVILTGRLGD